MRPLAVPATVTVTIRLTESQREEIDAIVKEETGRTGYNVSRTNVCRRLIDVGLKERKRKR